MNRWTVPSQSPQAIVTERTVGRAYEKGDGPALFAAVNAARDPLFAWLPWAKTEHLDVEESIHYVVKAIRSEAAPDCRHFQRGVFEGENDPLLGGIGFYRVDTEQSCAEVGYWMRPDRHGEGLCTEAVSRFISQGLTSQEQGGWGFRRITLLCAEENRASSRIAEKLGMRLERRERAERFVSSPGLVDGYKTSLGYAVLNDEWDFDAHRARPGIGWDDFLTVTNLES